MIAREPVQERLLIDATAGTSAQRVLCNTVGRAQFAAAYAQRSPQSEMHCWFLDLYAQEQSRKLLVGAPQNLYLACQADPPDEVFDLVAWAMKRQGDSELVRDMLQSGHARLAMGGQMVVAVDNVRDTWVHELLRPMFAKVSRKSADGGIVYLATKSAPLRKHKAYAAEFPFRDGERLIHLRTRPGVFSHRELDGGARALLRTMEVQSGKRVLDLGCGSGAVGIAAALRADNVQVAAIDSNPRAVEAFAWAATKNGIADRAIATLDCDGRTLTAASFGLVLANPPYYSDYRIAQLFLGIAGRALCRGGQLLLVTKTPDWYVERLNGHFANVGTEKVGNYLVVSGHKSSDVTFL